MRHDRKMSWGAALTCLCLLACLAAPAEVSVRSASVHFGFSLRFKHNTTGVFQCEILNGDDVARKVTLRLLPADSFMSNVNNFSDTVTVPAKSKVVYKSELVLENAEKYLLECFADGRKVGGQKEEVLLKYLANKSEQIGVVGGRGDVSMGAFTQLKEYKDKYFTTSFTAETLPTQWEVYDSLACLVVLDPDLSQVTPRQSQALLDYVHQGGVLFFAYPPALPALAATPLAELLPVYPGKLRKITALPCLAELPGFTGWPYPGVDFLESVPKDATAVKLWEGEFPVVAWKKYGLGSCGFLAVPLTEETFRNKAAWRGMLDRFFNHFKLFQETDGFKACLDEMTGFSIPAPRVVWTIVTTYFAALALLAALGLAFRRAGLAWTLAVCVSLLATFLVLSKAASGNRNKGKLLSVVELRDLGSANPAEGYYSLFSNDNAALTIQAADANATLCAIRPNAASIFIPGMLTAQRQNQGAARSSALQVAKSYVLSRADGTARILDIDLKARSTRQFAGFFSSDLARLAPAPDYPELVYSATGHQLKPWKLPAGLKPERAYLLLPSGAFPLEIKDGTLSLTNFTHEGVFQADNVLRLLEQALLAGYKRANPCLALVEPLKTTSLPIPDNVAGGGKTITIVPVTERCDGGELTLLPEQVVFTSGDNSSRMVMPGNTLRDSGIGSAEAMDFVFDFKIPPVFSALRAKEIVVDFSYLNQGGNITATPLLLTTTGIPLKGKALGGDKFLFSGPGVEQALNPVDGSGQLKIDSEEKEKFLDPGMKMRANKWAIKKLGLSVRGKLPESMTPLKY